MKPIKNLTRFTYETSSFEGWRLAISSGGASFTKYFSDKKYGNEKKSLAEAKRVLAEIKTILDESPRKDNKLTNSTIKKVEGLLKAS